MNNTILKRAAFCLFAALLLSGCMDDESLALPVETITIETHHGPERFGVEIAADRGSQMRGLMYRKSMAPDAGMIFLFTPAQFVSFWMKNTYIPLDMLFVRSDGTISTIEPNAVPMSLDSIPSAEPVRAVIELNGGRAHDLGIEPGDRVLAPQFSSGPRTGPER